MFLLFANCLINIRNIREITIAKNGAGKYIPILVCNLIEIPLYPKTEKYKSIKQAKTRLLQLYEEINKEE